MVLLTSSAVSAVISAGVICIFTFLLFLSGYVLQQQTVRSLQEALRRPPEPKPVPTLPAAFQTQDNVGGVALPEEIKQVVVGGSQAVQQAKDRVSKVIVEVDTTAAASEQKGEDATASDIPDFNPGTSQSAVAAALESQPTESLAYILSLPNPSDLCSAVLFAKWQRQYTALQRNPTIMILYPTTWETSPTPLHMSALTFMREIQDEHSLTYHPVNIDSVWAGVGLNAHLLGELQRIRWDFDRAMYLKSPGLAVDTGALDRALAISNIKTSWAPLSASTGQDPEMLLYSRKKGLMMARGDMRQLTATILTSYAEHNVNGMEVEGVAQNAAYVLFAEDEFENRRTEKEWYGETFERFERERRNICKDRGLLTGDEDKLDLRR